MRVCGIDPGNTGAVCVLDSISLGTPAILDFHGQSAYDIANWIHNKQIDIIWVESLHSLFQVSAKSNFGLGRSVGLAISVAEIVSRGIRPQLVTPKVWQKFAGVTMKGKAIKHDVANLAINLYPTVNLHGPRGGLRDGRSDALMITHYGIHHIP